MPSLHRNYLSYIQEAAIKEPELYDRCFTKSGKLRNLQGYFLRGMKQKEPSLEELVTKVHFPKSKEFLKEKKEKRRNYQKLWMKKYRAKLKLQTNEGNTTL